MLSCSLVRYIRFFNPCYYTFYLKHKLGPRKVAMFLCIFLSLNVLLIRTDWWVRKCFNHRCSYFLTVFTVVFLFSINWQLCIWWYILIDSLDAFPNKHHTLSVYWNKLPIVNEQSYNAFVLWFLIVAIVFEIIFYKSDEKWEYFYRTAS